MKKRPCWRALAAMLAIVALVGGACGNDDEEAATGGDATATTAENGGGEAPGGFCAGYMELLAGDPSPEQIRQVAAEAPEAGKAPLEAIASGFESQGEGFFETPEFGENFAAIGEVANEECADQTIDVTGVDYAFEGIPSEIEAGIIGVNFTNEGTEFHELVVFKRNEGVEQSFDEIFAGSEEEAEALVTEHGGTFTEPGDTSGALLELTEPGEYVAICFIPQGSTPENEEASGPPHFTLGMKAEFTVS